MLIVIILFNVLLYTLSTFNTSCNKYPHISRLSILILLETFLNPWREFKGSPLLVKICFRTFKNNVRRKNTFLLDAKLDCTSAASLYYCFYKYLLTSIDTALTEMETGKDDMSSFSSWIYWVDFHIEAIAGWSPR